MSAAAAPVVVEALRAARCTPHPLVGRRPGLSSLQLDDLVRGAVDADDRFAYRIITLAMIPAKFGWVALPIELDAMAYAVDAWVGRCRRSGGRPWMRAFGDALAERSCPGCEACIGPRGAR